MNGIASENLVEMSGKTWNVELSHLKNRKHHKMIHNINKTRRISVEMILSEKKDFFKMNYIHGNEYW